MRNFLVGGPQLALGYFREFGNAIAYWNYLTLGEGVTELQNLGIDPESVQMYELKFAEDEDPDFVSSFIVSNARSRERRIHELQKSFDAVSDGSCQTQGNNTEVLAKARDDTRTSS